MSLFSLFKFIHDIFKFHVFVKQFYQIKHTSTLKHVCQVLKIINVTCFSFLFLCPSSYSSKPYYNF